MNVKDEENQLYNYFWNNRLDKLREYCGEVMHKTLTNIINNDYEKLDELLSDFCQVRENIEYNKEVIRNKEFYYGYMVAFENIIQILVDENNDRNEFEKLLGSDELFRKLFMYISEKKFVNIKDVSTNLQISREDIIKCLDRYDVKKLNVLYIDVIGKFISFSLSLKGQEYYGKLISTK